MKANLFYLFLIFLILGCDSSPSKSDINKTVQDLKGLTTSMFSEGSNKAQKLATDEVEKLHRIEYKVVELPVDLPASKLEAKLIELGAERWDCFNIRSTEDNLILSCKRNTKTWLRYFPSIIR